MLILNEISGNLKEFVQLEYNQEDFIKTKKEVLMNIQSSQKSLID